MKIRWSCALVKGTNNKSYHDSVFVGIHHSCLDVLGSINIHRPYLSVLEKWCLAKFYFVIGVKFAHQQHIVQGYLLLRHHLYPGFLINFCVNQLLIAYV